MSDFKSTYFCDWFSNVYNTFNDVVCDKMYIKYLILISFYRLTWSFVQIEGFQTP